MNFKRYRVARDSRKKYVLDALRNVSLNTFLFTTKFFRFIKHKIDNKKKKKKMINTAILQFNATIISQSNSFTTKLTYAR